MAHYIVRATPKVENLAELRARLDREEFTEMDPFGRTLTHSLENARFDSEAHEAVWEEVDYCTPPLAMERDAVLDEYFEELSVEQVPAGDGWERIDELPSLWESQMAAGQ